MASKPKSDPTVTSDVGGDGFPEGTHPARPPAETSYSPERFSYKDNPDKPDSTSVAQVVVDPLDK